MCLRGREGKLPLVEKRMRSSKLPTTDSIEELARFWDSHDLIDFAADLEEVAEPVFERTPGTAMVLRLEPEEAQAVERMAQARGVEQSELLQEWVREKLGAARQSSRG